MAEESQPWWVLDNGSGTMKASFGPRQSQRLRETMWVITEGKHKGNTQFMKMEQRITSCRHTHVRARSSL